MSKIYDLTGSDVDHLIQELISSNPELKELEKKEPTIKNAFLKFFYADENECGDISLDRELSEISYNKASLYFQDCNKHICVKSLVISLLKVIFSQEVWELVERDYLRALGELEKGILAVDIFIIVNNLKKLVVENIKDLKDDNFCIYLQIVMHFWEHKNFTRKDIESWLPDSNMPCSWAAVRNWRCEFCKEGKCCLKECNNYTLILEERLKKMLEEGILIPGSEGKENYKVNY